MKKISKFLAISALALTTIPTSVFAASETASVKISIPDSLTLTLSADNLTFNLEDASLHTDKLTVTAKTNAAAGYTISFNANNDYNDLKHANTLVEDKIASIAEDKTEETFPETAWAYSTDLEDYTFKKIPLTPENVFATTSKGENSHDLTIGMRAKNIAAGDYENELIFTAVANPEPGPLTLSKITNMQEMTSEICAASAEHETKQLTDVRDNKTYWVTKLKDGDCWMTQNLDLDLSTDITLTPQDSDIISNWTPSRNMIQGAENFNHDNWIDNNNSPYAFNPGEYYYDSVYSNSAECYYLNESCVHFSVTPYLTNNEHGQIGNYYNWSAAVASNDTSNMVSEGSDVETSICPAGWRLPHGYHSKNNNDFAELFNAYEVSQESDEKLLSAPLFFTRGGYIGSGYMSSPSRNGVYWSSTPLSENSADDFYFFSSRVYTYDSINRYYGANIRCIAR